MSLHKFGAIYGALVLAAASGAATASSVPAPTGDVDVTGMMPMTFDYTAMSTVTPPPTGGTVYNFAGNQANTVWDYTWNFDADSDPLLSGMLTFTNLTTMTQTFSVSLDLPISPAFTPAFKTGSLGFSFSDTDGSGAASVDNISWDGLIDGSSAMQLLLADTSCGGVGCGFSVAPVSSGPLLHAPGVSTDIGILLSFALSAGDTVTFNTSFEVTPVPVPAAVWLLGSGFIGLIGIARRRRT